MCQTFRRSVLIFVPLILRWKIYYIRKERCNSISPPKAKRKYLDHINTNTHSHTHTHIRTRTPQLYNLGEEKAHISIQAGIVNDYLHISFWGRESFRRMLLSLFRRSFFLNFWIEVSPLLRLHLVYMRSEKCAILLSV